MLKKRTLLSIIGDLNAFQSKQHFCALFLEWLLLEKKDFLFFISRFENDDALEVS